MLRFWVLSIIFSLMVVSARAAAPQVNNDTIPLRSVKMLKEVVLASTQNGIFRADKKLKQWEKADTPEKMPSNGKFATGDSRSERMLYYSPSIFGLTPGIGDQKPGVYLSEDQGVRWRLVSNAHTFKYIHINNDTVYAIITVTKNTSEGKRSYRDRILKSSDYCKTWHDITGNIRLGDLYRIFDNPDNPKLVCIDAWSIRGYVLVNTSDTDQWTEFYGMGWHERHKTDKSFLASYYSASWRAIVHKATLTNYFLHDFGERVQLPAFELTTDKASYEFGIDEAKPVTVEIKFRLPDSEETLVDLKDGQACWFLRVIRPDGKRIWSPHKGRAHPASAKEYFRSRNDFTTFKLTKNLPYKRKIDLNNYREFQKPGLYQVQILYQNEDIASREHNEWPGSFSGNRFEVVIH